MHTIQPIFPMRMKEWEWEVSKMGTICFILGAMFGGTIATVFMCCLQINRADISNQEQSEKEKEN